MDITGQDQTLILTIIIPILQASLVITAPITREEVTVPIGTLRATTIPIGVQE